MNQTNFTIERIDYRIYESKSMAILTGVLGFICLMFGYWMPIMYLIGLILAIIFIFSMAKLFDQLNRKLNIKLEIIQNDRHKRRKRR